MKKSNKILIGGLLTIILVIVAVNIGLYANYKAGNVVPFTESQAENATSIKEFANTRSIHIRNLNNVVLRIGDRLKVEQYGEDVNGISLTEENGVVNLFNKDSSGAEKIFNYIIVYVPDGSTISTYKTYTRLDAQNIKRINNLNVKATGGYFGFDQAMNMQVDSLNLVAENKATIGLHNAHINKLNVQLSTSEMMETQAVINEITLSADNTSRISMNAKNLLKLTTKTSAHE